MTSESESEGESCIVVADSLPSHGLYSLWNSPGQNTGVGSLSLLQGIFPTWGSNPGLPHCRRILYQLSHSMNMKPTWDMWRVLALVQWPCKHTTQTLHFGERNWQTTSLPPLWVHLHVCSKASVLQISDWAQDRSHGTKLLRWASLAGKLPITPAASFWMLHHSLDSSRHHLLLSPAFMWIHTTCLLRAPLPSAALLVCSSQIFPSIFWTADSIQVLFSPNWNCHSLFLPYFAFLMYLSLSQPWTLLVPKSSPDVSKHARWL